MLFHEQESLCVSAQDVGHRLDKYLTDQFDGKSRSYFQYLIAEGKVKVNEQPAKKRYKVQESDRINIHFILPPEISLSPEEIPLNIIYEDNFLFAVNKPPGMVVHPSPGNWSGTLVNAILYYCGNIENPENTLRPGIVHRLDKDTSGLILVAKTYPVQQLLMEMFAQRTIRKHYMAICIGNAGEKTIRASIGRHSRDRKKMTVTESGKTASSIFHTLCHHEGLSLVRILIETGRTHQIRVHAQYNQTPVLGDMTYGNLSKNKKLRVERQLLHASQLSFMHPVTKNQMDLQAPLPHDFLSVCKRYFPCEL